VNLEILNQEKVLNVWNILMNKDMKNTDFNLLAKKAFENAMEKGFHEKPKTDAHWLMLVACELAEAVEADREGRRSDKKTYNFLLQEYGEPLAKHLFEMHIKDTVEDELADAVIRLLDFVGVKGYDIPENYITEEKIKEEAAEVKEWMVNKSFTDVVFTSCLVNIESAKEIPEALMYAIFVVAELYGIDLIWHIKEKMMYNETREHLHGKEY
jgi:NTP pyrophosphatase (non-canonical NTP hydrolase)